nr:MAG TPA: hypothetical protein [Caudoviricetes sp.]
MRFAESSGLSARKRKKKQARRPIKRFMPRC